MRLRARIFLMAGLLLLFVSAMGALSLMVVEKRLSLRNTEERQNVAWETVAGIFREAHITRDPLLLLNTVKMIKRTNPELRWLCVVDPTGRILASHDLNLFGVERRSVKLPEGLRLLVRPVVSDGANLGRIEIGSQEDTFSLFSSHSRRFLSKLVAWLIVMGLGFASFILGYKLFGAH